MDDRYRTMSSEEVERSMLLARIKKLEQKVEYYEWIAVIFLILSISRLFF